MCSDTIGAFSQVSSEKRFVDTPFLFQEWRKAFKTFFGAFFMEKWNSGLCFLAMFDAVTTKAIESIELIFQELKEDMGCIEERDFNLQEYAPAPRGRATKSYSRTGKSAFLPHKIAIFIKSYY